jgi:hypothetical protein
LSNLYGTGNSCSSYGNRNFWRIYYEWFGNPTGPGYAASSVSGSIYTSNTYSTLMPYANSEFYLKPNQSAYVSVVIKNTGGNIWFKSNTRLGTASPYDRSSSFASDTWLSQSRASSMQENEVAPGEDATFRFKITAPAQTGIYSESFQVVVEGVTWVKNYSPRFVLNVVQPLTDNELVDEFSLASGQALVKGQSISSPDRNSLLVFQRSGNLELYKNNKLSWQTNTSGQGNTLVNQPDGNLVIYNPSNQAVWSSGTFGGGSSSLVVQNDGNTVLYGGSGPTWSTQTAGPSQRDVLGIKMVGTAKLFKGQRLFSPDKRRVLALQADGNLVLYSNGKGVWSSKTFGSSAEVLYLQSDGNLVLYNSTSKPVWSTRTFGKGSSQIVLQSDGNLVLYSKAGATWHTNTRNR